MGIQINGSNDTISAADGGISISGQSIDNANLNLSQNLSVGGITTVSAGNASAPSITPSGDPNTGIFFPAADTIAFAEGGTEGLRINSSGNLGIGTTNPSAKLDLRGNFYFANEPEEYATAIRSFTNGHVVANRGKKVRFGMSDGSFAGMEVKTFQGPQVSGNYNAQDVIVYTHNGGLVGDIVTFVARHTGECGIGSTTPTGKLDVAVTSKTNIRLTNSSENAILSFRSNGVSDAAKITASEDSGGGVLSFNTKTTGGVDTARMSITSNAYVRLESGMGGLQFGGDTAAANALDDYEEGTWTPGLSIGASSSDGRYIKIGAMVYCYGSVTFPSTSSGAQAQITGLPFQAGGGRAGGGFTRYTGISNGHKIGYHVSVDSTVVDFYNNTDNGVAITNIFCSTGRLDFCLVYSTF